MSAAGRNARWHGYGDEKASNTLRYKAHNGDEQENKEGGEVEDEVCSEAFLRRISGEEDLTSLRSLVLSVDTNVSQVDQLGIILPRLSELRLERGSTLASFRDLGSSLVGLRVLWVNACGVRHLDGVGALAGLEELYLAFNDVDDLTSIAMHERLEVLDLESNNVQDVDQANQLGTCPRLWSLTLAANPICRAEHYRRMIVEAVPHLASLDEKDVTDHDRCPPPIPSNSSDNFSSPFEENRMRERSLELHPATKRGTSCHKCSPSSPVLCSSDSDDEMSGIDGAETSLKLNLCGQRLKHSCEGKNSPKRVIGTGRDGRTTGAHMGPLAPLQREHTSITSCSRKTEQTGLPSPEYTFFSTRPNATKRCCGDALLHEAHKARHVNGPCLARCRRSSDATLKNGVCVEASLAGKFETRWRQDSHRVHARKKRNDSKSEDEEMGEEVRKKGSGENGAAIIENDNKMMHSPDGGTTLLTEEEEIVAEAIKRFRKMSALNCSVVRINSKTNSTMGAHGRDQVGGRAGGNTDDIHSATDSWSSSHDVGIRTRDETRETSCGSSSEVDPLIAKSFMAGNGWSWKDKDLFLKVLRLEDIAASVVGEGASSEGLNAASTLTHGSEVSVVGNPAMGLRRRRPPEESRAGAGYDIPVGGECPMDHRVASQSSRRPATTDAVFSRHGLALGSGGTDVGDVGGGLCTGSKYSLAQKPLSAGVVEDISSKRKPLHVHGDVFPRRPIGGVHLTETLPCDSYSPGKIPPSPTTSMPALPSSTMAEDRVLHDALPFPEAVPFPLGNLNVSGRMFDNRVDGQLRSGLSIGRCSGWSRDERGGDTFGRVTANIYEPLENRLIYPGNHTVDIASVHQEELGDIRGDHRSLRGVWRGVVRERGFSDEEDRRGNGEGSQGPERAKEGPECSPSDTTGSGDDESAPTCFRTRSALTNGGHAATTSVSSDTGTCRDKIRSSNPKHGGEINNIVDLGDNVSKILPIGTRDGTQALSPPVSSPTGTVRLRNTPGRRRCCRDCTAECDGVGRKGEVKDSRNVGSAAGEEAGGSGHRRLCQCAGDIVDQDSRGKGAANVEHDERLVALLRQRPKHVPQLRTRQSFRAYFRGMDPDRLVRLLRAAYADCDAEECDAKVKKRLLLMEQSWAS